MAVKEISSRSITNIIATSIMVRLITDGEMEDPASKARIEVTMNCHETDIKHQMEEILRYLRSLPAGLNTSYPSNYGDDIMTHTIHVNYDEDTNELDFSGYANYCIINIDYVKSEVKEAVKKYLAEEILST